MTSLHFTPVTYQRQLVLLSDPSGKVSSWRQASRLDAFSCLSHPNVATQRCSWQNNWYTSGTFNPVLSY